MSKKQWLALLMLFATYLFLGASIFYHIESRLEIENVANARQERIEIHALLAKHYHPQGGHDQQEILEKLTEYCGKSVFNYTDGETDYLKWDFYNSFYFAYTVVSTIGYGNLAPTNTLGRILMIFYGLVGIPMNGILLAQLGEFFGQVFVTAVKKYKSYKQNHNDYSKRSLTSLEKRRAGLAMQIFMYLTPGFVMFIFFPAFLFSYYEGWDYSDSVYYAFVTLTTIGFGDLVAGQDNRKGSGIWFALYKTFLICWISFGLGYIVMIMTFIGRGMTSKKIARIEHKVAMKLKQTQSKIWQEFNEDVNYLRRVFNELQLSKVKRVYVDEYDYEYDTPPPQFPRSNSFPDLRDLIYGGMEPSPPCPRRRANSEVVPMESQVARVVSETDLQRIDKRATFATHAMVQPAELLARLVNILGYIPPPDDNDDSPAMDQTQTPGKPATNGGVQGFSEKEILASENLAWNSAIEPKWKLGGDSPRPCRRSRAASEVRLDRPSEMLHHPNPCEWTWSGPAASTKIKELMRARKSAQVDSFGNDYDDPTTTNNGKKSRFLSLALPAPKTLLPRWVRQQLNGNKKARERSMSVSVDDIEGREFMSQPQTPGGRPSHLALPERRNSYSRPYYTHTGGDLAGSNLLEETSLADFIRALSALHSHVGAVPDELSRNKPQRKLGTASLTPPKLPSLLSLFSPPAGHSQSQQNTVTGAAASNISNGRRFSLRTVDNSSTSTPLYQRRATQGTQARPAARRLSSRPAGATQRQYSYSASVDERPSSPPYSPEPFVLDNPKKALVEQEGAPGVSSPVAVPNRRFSLRPAQIGVPPAPSTASAGQQQQQQQVNKPIPRWKATMLQRQLGPRHHMSRRARAFSLSDVHSDESEKRIGTSPLALEENARTITSIQGQKFAAQKSVTILVSSSDRRFDDQHIAPFALRRCGSDIESVSSKSSTQSTKSLDSAGAAGHKNSAASSLSSSGKSSANGHRVQGGASGVIEQRVWSDEWDFPPTSKDEPSTSEAAAARPNDRILDAIAKESEEVTRRLSAASSSSDVAVDRTMATPARKSLTAQPSASRKPSVCSIETWAESKSRKTSTTTSPADATKDERQRFDVPEVRIDVPEEFAGCARGNESRDVDV